ncbi:hypothetical protein SEA_GOCRAZY_24 [Arthrobacter phage GoCrazy]|uniref:Uncharacterized protein n=12 Tax=Mudcatvirus TaxID=1982088 RepID=A0A222Z7G7_9CAUD|nr:hypothetical protein BI184_gp25 [Arthrobacter phage Mudcat]YP_009603115.1 hypothetical protein FDH65_gp26 [Arthrobacter phage Circum]YP_010666014.1 hypothetical protein PQB74_gp26 [Arthrobacter phage Arcadia]YP_010666111.1 hypothetical protein PQB75_gp026 [Arthrobacter phage Tribby]YP_010666213.1 hypothetical protein PQB76_gp026 [Arthrobacter phage Cheesy]YP_010666313.1 hypothetical protein PQB77_gp25 [Arthrobacter phage Correa]YP_010666408.1 hypothetical protein PQB78_gp24 [Arthrobacter p
MNAQDIATILGAGGGGAVLVALGTGIFKWLSGAAGRERVRNTNLLKRSREAEAERDEADEKRREAEEHVSILRRQLREAGLTPLEREDVNTSK